jgi:hypothetical protein
MHGVAALAVALASLVGVHAAAGTTPNAPASPATHNPQTFTDPAGDSGGGPDVSSIVVSNTAAGRIRIEVLLANATTLRNEDFIGVFIDADRNTSTGPANGFEYTMQTAGLVTPAVLGRWDGTAFVPVSGTSLVKIWAAGRGVAFDIASADLSNTTGFRFWAATDVLTGSDDFDDLAPDGDAVYNYALSTPHIASVRARFSPAAPRAGRRFGVAGVTARLTTNEEMPAASFRCRATLARKALRGRGVGGCTFTLARNAKGKRLTIVVTATLAGDSRTLTRSFTVR